MVKVLNARGEDLEFPLTAEETYVDPFQIRDVDGLGPVNAFLSTVPFGSYDGERNTGEFVGKRNITFTVGLNPNWDDQSVASLRNLLYRYLLPKQRVTLQFFSDHLPTVGIVGYVETFEPNIFSKEPEIQISVMCPEPDFVAIEASVVTGVTSDGPFKLPDPVDFTAFDYVGTSPTGFKLTISNSVVNEEYLDGPITVSNEIDSPGLAYSESIAFDGTIDSVTEIEISSVSGDKHIHSIYTGTGAITNLLDTVYDGEAWPKLIPGENKISVTAQDDQGGGTGAGLNWSLEYFNRFGGL